MGKDKLEALESRVADESRSALDEIIREGAMRMLRVALEEEVAAYIEKHSAVTDDSGRRLVVRNGYLPGRVI